MSFEWKSMFVASFHFNNFFVTHGHIPATFNLLHLMLSTLSHSQSPQHSKTYLQSLETKPETHFILWQSVGNLFHFTPWIVPRIPGHLHSAQDSTEIRSLHRRGRETKKLFFLLFFHLLSVWWGGAAHPWRFCRSAHEQTQAPRSLGLLLPKGATEVFLKYTGCSVKKVKIL